MAFTSGVTSSAAVGRLYLFRDQALCVARDVARDAARGAEGVRIATGPVPAGAVFLGELDGEPCFAAALEPDDPVPEGSELVPIRQLFGALPEHDFALAGRGLGLVAWDRDHRCCGRCGAPTSPSTTERVRTCSRCGHGAYPRLSPAVIVLVVREGRALLARNARFAVPFHSTLAGFVEVGESLEQAVGREIREEVGIEVDGLRYFGSQPWPFTSSLMIAFTARWASGELRPDGQEIVEAGWFAPDQLPRVPPPLSIARQLIDDFVRSSAGPPATGGRPGLT
jgi:NAD+ diphosphatase